jgi:hypothetical protein
MPYIEWIGEEVPSSLAKAIKAHNVSPADYYDLENVWGNDYASIERDIKRYTVNGSFSVFEFWNRRPMCGHCDGPHEHRDCPANRLLKI